VSEPCTAQPDVSHPSDAPLAGKSLRPCVAPLQIRADALKECCRVALATGDLSQLVPALEENIEFESALFRAAIKSSQKACATPDRKKKD